MLRKLRNYRLIKFFCPCGIMVLCRRDNGNTTASETTFRFRFPFSGFSGHVFHSGAQLFTAVLLCITPCSCRCFSQCLREFASCEI